MIGNSFEFYFHRRKTFDIIIYAIKNSPQNHSLHFHYNNYNYDMNFHFTTLLYQFLQWYFDNFSCVIF